MRWIRYPALLLPTIMNDTDKQPTVPIAGQTRCPTLAVASAYGRHTGGAPPGSRSRAGCSAPDTTNALSNKAPSTSRVPEDLAILASGTAGPTSNVQLPEAYDDWLATR